MASDWYALLGVSPDADDAAIRRAYRRAALRFHPDKNSDEDARENFHAISEAFTVLTSPELRGKYDILQEQGQSVEVDERDDLTNYFRVDLQERMSRVRHEESSLKKDILENLKREGYEQRRTLDAMRKHSISTKPDSKSIRTIRYGNGSTKTFTSLKEARDNLDSSNDDFARVLQFFPAQNYSEIYEAETLSRLKKRATHR